MPHHVGLRFPTIVLVLGCLGCASGTAGPSRVVSATSLPTPTTTAAPSTKPTPSATPTYLIAATLAPDTTPEASATPTLKTWTGTMSSSSNYTVTAQDGGLVCSATWATTMAFDVAADSSVRGTATSTMQGQPVCAHPEYYPSPITLMVSSLGGSATATELRLQLAPVSSEPAGSFDATGMSASIYGINTAPPTITIPITSSGHAEGSQQLQTVSAVNSYTSDNTITLECAAC